MQKTRNCSRREMLLASGGSVAGALRLSTSKLSFQAAHPFAAEISRKQEPQNHDLRFRCSV